MKTLSTDKKAKVSQKVTLLGVVKKWEFKLCEMHPDCEFLAYTNGTLIDEEFCQEMLRVKNCQLHDTLDLLLKSDRLHATLRT